MDFGDLEKHNLILQEKHRQVEENEVLWDGYRLEDADVVLVSYGISSRILICGGQCQKGGNPGGALPAHNPLSIPHGADRVKLADRGCKFISVEMSNGQMRDDIRLASGCRPVELVCRYGGNLINIDEIMDKIRVVA